MFCNNFFAKKNSLTYNYNLLTHSPNRTLIIFDLVIYLDTKLKINDHFNKIINKAASRLNILKQYVVLIFTTKYLLLSS